MRRAVVIGVVVVALGAAAGIYFSTRSSSLDPRVATAYVNAQARALCVVQSKSYPTQKQLEAAYKRAQTSSNLTSDEFKKAASAAEKDSDLRTRVSRRVTVLCG
jgi:hypothetical protein